MSYGLIATIIREVEQRRTAFAVARLVMMTGVDFRAFLSTSEDDERVLVRLLKVLPNVLNAAEISEIESKIR
jgi:hypothetical protein